MSVQALQKVFDVSHFPQPLREHSSLGQTLCAVEGLHRLIGERVATANRLDALGAHKQIVNRVLEPFSHISVVVTSTEWDNFFALRRREDADPIMQALAYATREAMKASSPRSLVEGEFHAPYLPGGVGRSEEEARVYAACCARVSAREQGLEAARMRWLDRGLAYQAKPLYIRSHSIWTPCSDSTYANPGGACGSAQG